MHCVAICIASSSCDLCLRSTRTTECALDNCTYRLCGRCAFLYYQTSVHKVCPACRRPDAFVVSKTAHLELYPVVVICAIVLSLI